MADRMNIKFSIQAVDRFSKTMNNLERKLDSVQRKANSLDLTRRVDIDVDTTQASAQLTALQQQINSLGGGDADIDVDVNTGGAISELAAIRAAIAAMNDARIQVDADTALASAQLATVQAQANQLGKRPTVVNVLVGGYLQFRRNMDRMATTGRTVGELMQNTFRGVATTFGTTLVPMIASTTGAIGSLGVMIGVTGGATMGLLSAFVGAGAAAGGFAAVAIPVIGRLNEAVEKVKDSQEKYQTALRQGNEKQAAKYLAEYEYALSQMSGEQRKAMENMDKFKSSFNEIADAAEPGVLNVYANTLKWVTSILEGARPMIDASVGAVQRLTESMNANIESADMQNFFNFLNTTGASSLQVISKAIGNFLMGFLNMMVAFGPLATDMQGGFLKMSEGFRDWTAALGDNSKFQAFVNYVRTNWPAVRTIIGTAIAAIIETFAGFSGYATGWMAMTQELINKWREFAQGMGQNEKFQAFLAYIQANAPKVNQLIGDFVRFLIDLGVAMAPVGSKMLEIASAVLQFFSRLLEANPEMSKMLGFALALGGGLFTLFPIFLAIGSAVSTAIGIFKLFGPTLSKIGGFLARVVPGFARLNSAFTTLRIVMMMIGGPVMWVIGILLLLVPVFMKLWQTSETFRNVMTTAWDAIKNAVSSAITAISTFIRSVWGSVVTWWTANGEMIKQAASNVWNVISTVITTAMTVIANIIKFVWPAVLFIITSVWNNIKGVISGAVNMIMGIVTIFAGLFTGNFSAMWEGVKQLFSGAIQFLWNAVQLLLWGKLIKGVVMFANLFRTGIMSMWTSVKTLFMNGINAVKNFFVNGFNGISNYIMVVWQRMGQYIDDGLTLMKTRIMAGLNAIKTFFSNAWTNIYVRVGDAMIAIRTAITTGMNAVRTFFSNVWTNIYVRVSDALISIRTVVTTTFNTVRTTVSNFVANVWAKISSGFNNIVAFIRGAFEDIAYVARIVSAGIRETIGNFVSAVLMRVRVGFNMMKETVVTVFNTIRSRVTSIASAIRERVVSTFNALKDRAIAAFNSLKDRAISAFNSLKDRALSAFNSLKDRAIAAANTAKDRVVSAWNNMKDRVVTAVQNILSKVRSTFDSIVNSVKTKMLFVKSAITKAWNEVMAFLRGIDLVQIGKDIITGLINGIKSMATGLLNAGKGVVKGAIDGIKGLLKSKSPSKLFRDIGIDMFLGMQIGIFKQEDSTVAAVTRVAEAMTNAFAPKLDAAMNVSGGYGGNGYSTAGASFAQARANNASRTVVEVPVYLNGREIAKASNDEQNRMNQRENARKTQFSRTGGTQ